MSSEKIILGSSKELSTRNVWVSHYVVIPELSSVEDPLSAVEDSAIAKDVKSNNTSITYFAALFKEDQNMWDVHMKRPHIQFWDRQLLEDLSESSLMRLLRKKIRFVIFDMDGLLLDTEYIYTKAQEEILAPLGVKFTNEVKCLMMGQKALDGAEALIEHYGIEDKLSPQEFVDKRAEICDKLFPTCKLLPGVENLLNHLQRHSIPAAVATGSSRKHFEVKIQSYVDLFKNSFSHIVTSDEVKQSKPDPEIFKLAASRFKGYGPEDKDSVLVLEDSPLGIEAANAAGFHSILLETDYNKNSANQSTQRLASLCDFQPELWGLPPF